MTTQPLLTYRDAYEHLLDVHDLWLRDTGQKGRTLRRAIDESYRMLPSLHDWVYFKRSGSLLPETPYSTGTIAYVASTYTLTLTSGTWPANVAEGHVYLNGIWYPVATRTSGTVIVLDSTNAPAENMNAGSGYEWKRFRYLLPVGVGDVLGVFESGGGSVQYDRSTPEDFTEIMESGLIDRRWSVLPSRSFPGRIDLAIGDVPSAPRQLRYNYKARAWKFPTSELSTGTVSTSGTTATFSSGVLTENHVGCVLRISATSTAPTSHLGKTVENGETTNSTIIEKIITAITSTTVAVLNQTPGTLTTRGYTISSLIDVTPDGMWDLFLRLCEQRYDIISRADSNIQFRSTEQLNIALRQAMIADNRGQSIAEPHYQIGWQHEQH